MRNIISCDTNLHIEFCFMYYFVFYLKCPFVYLHKSCVFSIHIINLIIALHVRTLNMFLWPLFDICMPKPKYIYVHTNEFELENYMFCIVVVVPIMFSVCVCVCAVYIVRKLLYLLCSSFFLLTFMGK